jgi:anthranilate phosphoribosyltransferase
MDVAAGYSREELEGMLGWLLDEGVAEEERADWLVGWAARGESAQEIADFAAILRERALPVELPEAVRGRLMDVCGTGGDGRQTFNVSTAVALALAASGVPVAKHGNRGLTSKSGGFDVLEVLGVPVPKSPQEAAEQFSRHGVCFLFAPFFHPVIGKMAGLRKLAAGRGSRTVFNLIGPLLNPARPGRQLLGIARPELLEVYAEALRGLDVEGGVVVCGRTAEGAVMDEFSTTGESQYVWWGGRDSAEAGGVRGFVPVRWGVAGCADEAVFQVGSARESAEVLVGVLSGQDRGPRAELVAVNLAGAFLAGGVKGSWEEALEAARGVLFGGAGLKLLDALRAGF